MKNIQYKLLWWVVRFVIVSAIAYLVMIGVMLLSFRGLPGSKTHIEFEKNGVSGDAATDSVIQSLYQEGELDGFYDKIEAYYYEYPTGELSADTLAEIKQNMLQLSGLDIVGLIKRYKMINKRLEPLGYKAYIEGNLTFFDSYDTEFSYLKLFGIWLFARYPIKAFCNPLYILIPNAILFLIISKYLRNLFRLRLKIFYIRILRRKRDKKIKSQPIIDRKYSIRMWWVVYFVLIIVTFLFAIHINCGGNDSYFAEDNRMVFIKDGVDGQNAADSIVANLYREGKLNYFYDEIKNFYSKRDMEYLLSKNALEDINLYFFTLFDLDIKEFNHRQQMIEQELKPKGYRSYLQSFSVHGYSYTEYSYSKLIAKTIVPIYSSKVFSNPLLYVLLPNALIILVISRFVRNNLIISLKHFAKNVFHRRD